MPPAAGASAPDPSWSIVSSVVQATPETTVFRDIAALPGSTNAALLLPAADIAPAHGRSRWLAGVVLLSA